MRRAAAAQRMISSEDSPQHFAGGCESDAECLRETIRVDDDVLLFEAGHQESDRLGMRRGESRDRLPRLQRMNRKFPSDDLLARSDDIAPRKRRRTSDG